MSRYIPVPDYKGIRKDLKTNNYQAVKKIDNKIFTKTFSSLKEAIRWRNLFHPDLPQQQEVALVKKRPAVLNGADNGLTFKDVWEKYKKLQFPLLEQSSIAVKLTRAKFFDQLMNVKMSDLIPEFFDDYIMAKKEQAASKRYNFNGELTELKAVLNWYQKNMDFTFRPPVFPRHKALGKIKELKEKNKKITIQEALSFFSFLPELYKDLAIFQFYIAGRIQEAAGIQVKSIDLNEKVLIIKDVIVWSQSTKRFEYLKPKPKNCKVRY